MIVAASLTALELLKKNAEPRNTIKENTAWFRKRLSEAGFTIIPGEHPIVPVMIGDAALAQEMAARLL